MFFAVETRKATLNMIHMTPETIKIKQQTDKRPDTGRQGKQTETRLTK